MRIDWWTLGFQTINVAVLIWILSRFLFTPVARLIAERQAVARKSLTDADAARSQAQAALAQAQEELQAQTRAKQARLRQAQSEAEAQARDILDRAREDAKQTLAQAKAEWERDAAERVERMEGDAAALAVEIAGALLKRLPDRAAVDGFEVGLAEALSRLPESSRADFAAPGALCRLKAPRALSAVEQAVVAQALGRVLGQPPALSLEVDAGLIAGLELETPHARIGNNLRDDLGRVAKALKAYGRE